MRKGGGGKEIIFFHCKHCNAFFNSNIHVFINKYQQSLDYENEIPHNIFQENTLMYVILNIEYLHFPLSLFVITLRV